MTGPAAALALSPRRPHLVRPLAPPRDLLLIEEAIMAIEAAPGGSRELDAACYRALGWIVVYDREAPRRGWRCRSPNAAEWQILPDPSRSRDQAQRLVPWGWSEGCGTRNRGPFAWTARRWPIVEGVPFFECSGLTVPLALCKAALHAWRYLEMRREDRA